MHRVKEYKKEIIEKNDHDTIHKMLELDDKAFCTLKDKDYDMAKWLSSEYRELARGTELDEEMIKMVLPTIKWSVEDTNGVKSQKGWSCDDMNFNFMANYFYHKFSDIINDDMMILDMAHKESEKAYHVWKILKMYK